MIRSISIVLFLGVGACTAQQAPGTRPADMTAQAHVQECRNHARIAQAQDQRIKDLDRSRGTYTPTYAGEREREVARQHEQAAKAIDPNAPECP